MLPNSGPSRPGEQNIRIDGTAATNLLVVAHRQTTARPGARQNPSGLSKPIPGHSSQQEPSPGFP